MPRNGSGTYSPPVNSWNPQTNGTLATGPDFGALLTDIANALTQSMSVDGQSPLVGNLNMNGNRLTNLAPGAGTGDSLRWEQLFSQGVETDIASAATTNIGTQNTNFLRVTGATTITSFGTTYNGPRFLRMEGVLTITNSASLICVGGVDIKTVAGDILIAIPKATAGTADGWYVFQNVSLGSIISAIQTQKYASFTTTGTSPAFVLTPSPAITAYSTFQRFNVLFHAAGTTGSNTINVSTLGAKNLKQYDASGVKQPAFIPVSFISDVIYDGTDFVVLDPATPQPQPILRNHIDGFIMSHDASAITINVGAGQAANSTNTKYISSSSAFFKTTGVWGVGNGQGGKLSGAAIANNTWYHWYVIMRADTGVVDAGFDVSATTPTLPTNYTDFRRIGAAKTDGSGNWTRFYQYGDLFQWETPILDVSTSGVPATAVLRTLNVPPGVRVSAIFNYGAWDSNNSNSLLAYFSDTATSDIAPTSSAPGLASSYSIQSSTVGNATGGFNKVEVLTDADGIIRTRITATPGLSGTATLRISTLAWRDFRGKN